MALNVLAEDQKKTNETLRQFMEASKKRFASLERDMAALKKGLA
ncbi:hypothetical protein [Methylacidiphilum caldifontis]|nr:hypothetical protein [Methylacidiphilum caldifontis]